MRITHSEKRTRVNNAGQSKKKKAHEQNQNCQRQKMNRRSIEQKKQKENKEIVNGSIQQRL